jgi:hypothetical protein
MSFIIPEFTTSIIDTGFTPQDKETRKLYKEVAAFAKQGQPIVIFGPAGSGKEFLARHYYSALIKSEIYTQWRKNWPLKYNAIKAQYSACYSGKNLEVFLSSVKPGIFHSINSSNIYPNLAESILFGQEENSSNGEPVRPGLLELIKCGVLFIEEMGELSKGLQSKLLRAFNSEVSEGCRISGIMNYSLKDIIIIPSTNQSQEKFRDDFYHKMGIHVTIKSINERPDDVRKSIPHFIRKAIGKRKDSSIIGKVFGTGSAGTATLLSGTREIIKFAEEQADLVADEILIRRWPGNFRALRTALEASIFRIERIKDPASFSDEFRKNLHHYIKQYSEDCSKNSRPSKESFPDNVVYPSKYPDMDRRILGRINSRRRFQDISDYEKEILATFLSSIHETGFTRKDLELFYERYPKITHTSEAHIRKRINKFLELNILIKIGDSKSIRYIMTDFFLAQVRNEDLFALPDVDRNWAKRNDKNDELTSLLSSIDRIYIKAPVRYGKSAFMTMFCHARQQIFNLYYYELGQEGIPKFFGDIYNIIKFKNTNPDRDKFLKDAVNNIHPFLSQIFKAKNGKKPVLIFDNAHFISEPDHMATLADLSKKWQEVILILIGEEMDNTLLRDFTEFKLDPWEKRPVKI